MPGNSWPARALATGLLVGIAGAPAAAASDGLATCDPPVTRAFLLDEAFAVAKTLGTGGGEEVARFAALSGLARLFREQALDEEAAEAAALADATGVAPAQSLSDHNGWYAPGYLADWQLMELAISYARGIKSAMARDGSDAGDFYGLPDNALSDIAGELARLRRYDLIPQAAELVSPDRRGSLVTIFVQPQMIANGDFTAAADLLRAFPSPEDETERTRAMMAGLIDAGQVEAAEAWRDRLDDPLDTIAFYGKAAGWARDTGDLGLAADYAKRLEGTIASALPAPSPDGSDIDTANAIHAAASAAWLEAGDIGRAVAAAERIEDDPSTAFLALQQTMTATLAAGDVTTAIAISTSLTQQGLPNAFGPIARYLAGHGQADAVAELVGDESGQHASYVDGQIALGLAEAGDGTGSLATVRAIDDPRPRAAIAYLAAKALAKAGDPAAAKPFLELVAPQDVSSAETAMAAAYAQNGETKEALAIVEGLTNAGEKSEAAQSIGADLAEAGDLCGAYLFTRMITMPYLRALALAKLAGLD